MKRYTGEASVLGAAVLAFGLLAGPVQADTTVFKGSFAKRTTTGAQSVTGVGFQPKAVIFFWTRQTAAGTLAGNSMGYGFAVATGAGNQAAVGVGSQDAVTTTNAGNRHSAAQSLIVISPTTAAMVAQASLTSLDADGFTLNWGTNEARADIIHFVALGGSDITGAKVGSFTAPTVVTNPFAVTGVGFQPDHVMFLAPQRGLAADTTGVDGSLSLGFMESASEQMSLAYGFRDGQTASSVGHIWNGARALTVYRRNAVDAGATFSSMDADGFTLNFDDAAGGTPSPVYYLALRGAGGTYFKLGTIQARTTAGTQAYAGVGFQPVGLMLFSTNSTAASGANEATTPAAKLMIGAASSTTAEGLVWAHDAAATTTDTNNATSTAALYRAGTGGTQDALADLTSFNADGFSLNWTDADTAAKNIIYLAIGSAPVVNPTTVGTVTATPSGCTSIAMGAPYTADANASNSLSYRVRTPSGSGVWSGATPVAHSVSPYAVTISGLTHGASHDVEVTYVDADGVTGTNPQTVSNVLVGGACTAAGTVSAVQTSGATPSIAVSASYTFDNDADNTLSYRYQVTASGSWTSGSRTHSATPYSFTLSGLACGTSYDVEVTYADPDGIGSGTPTQVVSGVVLDNCSAAGTATAAVDSCSQITVSAPFTLDADADGSASFERGATSTGPWTAACSGVTGASPRICVDGGRTASTVHYYRVTYSDPDAVGGTAQQVIGPYSTPACNVLPVSPQTATATAASCSRIDVSAPFTGDTNANSATQVEYNTSDSWPGTTAAGCGALTGASPRACAITGLANAAAYFVRVSFTDADGVNPPATQVLGPVSTYDCRLTTGTPSGAADTCQQVSVTAPFSGDFDADGTASFERGASATGPWTAACSGVTGGSPKTCADTGVAESSSYYYRVTFADADGVLGANPQAVGPVATPACSVAGSTAGTASALVSGCSQITVSAPFDGDDDRDGAVKVEYSTTGTWPGTTSCATVMGASPRTCQIVGLAASTAHYVRVTYSDPDGVTGPAVQVLPGTYTTAACSGNNVGPMILFIAPTRDATVGATERFKVQVYDPDGVLATNILWGVDGAAPAAPVTHATNVDCNLGSQTACRVVYFDLDTTGLANGSHSVSVRATDSAATPSVSQLALGFRVSNSGVTATGAGNLLRRTHSSQMCADCHNLATHSSQATDTSYGSWSQECLTCHTPHETTNISLIRNSIQTPRSGWKPVDFRNTTGKADFSYATLTTPGAGVCEACHTQTRNTDLTPRFRNTGESDGGKHYTSRCTGCHSHALGFAAGESGGGSTCAGCHPDIWNGMNGTIAKASRHSIGSLLGTNDAFTDSGLTWASPLSGNLAADRSCLNMCHDDHPHDLTSPLTQTHDNSVYRDATSSATRKAGTRTSADKDKTDFQAADANGGLCVSCHRNPVTASRPAISKAAYDASAHDFVSNTANATTYNWTYTLHDGGVFTRNCTKCHSDGDAAPGATAIPFGAVHFSDNPKLLSGKVQPNGVAASLQCYACHGNGTAGTDRSGKDIATQIAKTRNHPADADNVHDSVTESSGAAFGNTLGVIGRHSNCLDCHDSHTAKAGTHAAGSNVSGPPLEGAWGAQLSTNPPFWTDTVTANFTRKTMVAGTDLEATLCFKCHTRYYWGTTATSGRGVPPAAPSGATYTTGTAAFTTGSATVTGTGTAWNTAAHVGWVIRNNANGTWHVVTAVASGTSLTISPAANFTAAASAYTLQMAETDVAKEFNPANTGNFAGTWAANETAGGFHPVLAAAGSNLGAITLTNLVTTNFAWSTTARNLMACTDCHESNTTTDPNGPHGSTAGFILRGPNTTWSAAVVQGAAGMPAGTFCANCHSATFASSRFATHYSRSNHRVACWNCHAAVPHGGPRPGMLIAPAGAAAGVGGSIAGWDTAQPYFGLTSASTGKLYIASYPTNNTTGWGQNNCGCNGTGH